MIILFFCKWHLNSIYKYLVPEVDSPADLHFQIDIDIRDPFDHLNKIPVPLYLRGGFKEPRERDHERNETDSEGEGEGDNSESEIIETKRPIGGLNSDRDSSIVEDSILQNEQNLEDQNSWMFKSGVKFLNQEQNRHERLFWLGWVGVSLQKFIIQGCYITLILWLSAIIAADGYDRFYVFDDQYVDIPIMIATIFIATFTILYYFPSVMFYYVLTTSIQMMKRKDYIELVIKEQKHQKNLRSMRMYQVFKLIRRELIEAFHEDVEDRRLPNVQSRLLKENFDMIKEPIEGENQLPLEKIDNYTHLNGNKLKKLESYLLIRKAGCDGEYVNYRQLDDAMVQVVNDVQVDPYDVIKRIFFLLANVESKVSLEQLEEFFIEYEGYFELDDVEEFKEEILCLQRDGGLIDIQEIASLIRDDIECFPR